MKKLLIITFFSLIYSTVLAQDFTKKKTSLDPQVVEGYKLAVGDTLVCLSGSRPNGQYNQVAIKAGRAALSPKYNSEMFVIDHFQTSESSHGFKVFAKHVKYKYMTIVVSMPAALQSGEVEPLSMREQFAIGSRE